jgi:hypothetical protein
MDDQLRKIERLYQIGDATKAEYLRAKLRAAQITVTELRLAAWCQDVDTRLALGYRPCDPVSGCANYDGPSLCAELDKPDGDGVYSRDKVCIARTHPDRWLTVFLGYPFVAAVRWALVCLGGVTYPPDVRLRDEIVRWCLNKLDPSRHFDVRLCDVDTTPFWRYLGDSIYCRETGTPADSQYIFRQAVFSANLRIRPTEDLPKIAKWALREEDFLSPENPVWLKDWTRRLDHNGR